jgi:hypothetical protein
VIYSGTWEDGMTKLKVFAGVCPGRKMPQVSTIIATTSQAQAAKAVGESVSSFRQYWSQTGNEIQCQIALSLPETLFQASGVDKKDYIAVPSKS